MKNNGTILPLDRTATYQNFLRLHAALVSKVTAEAEWLAGPERGALLSAVANELRRTARAVDPNGHLSPEVDSLIHEVEPTLAFESDEEPANGAGNESVTHI